MPGIAHLIFGMFIVIPIMYIAKDRLNYKVAFIFAVNCWNGPDSYWPWRFIPVDGHDMWGFFFWAIPLSLFYSYITRFSMVRSKKFIKFVDDGKRDVKWLNAYLLCIGGSILHIFIDMFFHYGSGSVDLWPGMSVSFSNFKSLWVSAIEISDAVIIIGFVLNTTVWVLMFFFLSKNLKDKLIFLFANIGLVFLLTFTVGMEFSGGELEAATIAFTIYYFFLPLMLLAIAANDVYNKPTKAPETSRINPKLGLKIVAALTCVLSTVFIVLGISAMLSEGFIAGLIGDAIPNEVMFIIGLLVVGAAGIGLVGGIGLFLKNKMCRNFAIFVSTLTIFFVFPFAITLYLCQDDVKALFEKESDRITQE